MRGIKLELDNIYTENHRIKGQQQEAKILSNKIQIYGC